MYGVEPENSTLEPGDVELRMSRMLPYLDTLCSFVSRVNACILNAIRELAAVYPNDASAPITLSGVHVTSVMAALGRLLAVLVTIDALINQNDVLKDDYGSFRRFENFVVSS